MFTNFFIIPFSVSVLPPGITSSSESTSVKKFLGKGLLW